MTALTDYTLPSTDEEVWRYSRVAELDLEAYAPADESGRASGVPDAIEAALATVPVRGVTIVTVNGQLAHVDVAAPGVDVITDAVDALGVAMSEPTDVFAAMNTDLTTAPVVVRVAPRATVEAPICIARWIAAANNATFPRSVVVAGDDSRAQVIEYFASSDD